MTRVGEQFEMKLKEARTFTVTGRKDVKLMQDYDYYNFKDSEDVDGWTIGNDDVHQMANAFIDGPYVCPEKLIVPRNLKNEDEVTKPVEVIGSGAYSGCGNSKHGPDTKEVLITKQVKIIKTQAFSLMHDVEKFVIEEGSVIQAIEEYGLNEVGLEYGKSHEDLRITLALPPTLSSIDKGSIFNCNLFNVITYCGAYPLENETSLYDGVDPTEVRVTNEYTAELFIGLTPTKDSELQNQCHINQGNITYDLTEEGVSITEIENDRCSKSLEVPRDVNGVQVVALGDKLFANCDNNGPISLPPTLKRIGISTFANMTHATAIICNSTELDIGEFAFQNCGSAEEQLINVSLPQNITTEKGAFYGAKIGEVYLL